MFKNIVFIISLVFFAFVNAAIAAKQTGSAITQDNVAANAINTIDAPDSGKIYESDEIFSEEEESEGNLEVTNAWARPSLSSNNNSAAYMTINNPTNKQITILGASAVDVANNVELHKSFVDEKGVSRMAPIDKIVVPVKSSISLAPGGIHIMLLELKRKLNVGDSFKIVLAIEDMDAITLNAEVK